MKTKKILFLSAEVAPFAKRGGLGDVAGALPTALTEFGHDVRVVMPAYQIVKDKFELTRVPMTLEVPLRDGVTAEATIYRTTLPNTDVPVYLIEGEGLFDRPEVYGYHDDVYRFAFYSRAALAFADAIQWIPDVIHANDWHTAPALIWQKMSKEANPFERCATVFTIHNLAYQGHSEWDLVKYLGASTYKLYEEFPNAINLMARGIYHADWVSTVSPTYAQEIMTPDFGCGLHNMLHTRRETVSGILNGLDYEKWNPEVDSRIPANYSLATIEDRVALRHALQEYAGLTIQDDAPLVGMISRLDSQKGLDITERSLREMLNTYPESQFVVLGTGDPRYEYMFTRLASEYPGRVGSFMYFDASLAPLIYAGADMFLMPSRFEPCGLSQMMAMRYGCVPIVHATGGLRDTVTVYETGFVFEYYSSEGLTWAINEAFIAYEDKDRWNQIQFNCMETRFSWQKSAAQYDEMYNRAIEAKSTK